MDVGYGSAALDVPFLDLSDPADARPAVLFHRGEVLEALEVHGDILSLGLSGFLADGEGLVDIIDASDLKVVGALGSEDDSEQGKHEEQEFHRCGYIEL